MKHLKKLAVVVVCTALTATAFAVAKKVDSSAGLSIINDSNAVVTTNQNSNCAIQFPTPIENEDSGSIITTNDSIYPCFAVYSNGCTIEVTGANTVTLPTMEDPQSCALVADGMAVEMTSSS